MKKNKDVWVHKKRSDNRWESRKTDTPILDEIADSLYDNFKDHELNSWSHPYVRKLGKEFLIFIGIGWIGMFLGVLLGFPMNIYIYFIYYPIRFYFRRKNESPEEKDFRRRNKEHDKLNKLLEKDMITKSEYDKIYYSKIFPEDYLSPYEKKVNEAKQRKEEEFRYKQFLTKSKELENLRQLLSSGSITQSEFDEIIKRNFPDGIKIPKNK